MIDELMAKIKKMRENRQYFNYSTRLLGTAVALSGAFLYLEHIYLYGLEPSDPFGHDFSGLALIVAGGLITLIQKK